MQHWPPWGKLWVYTWRNHYMVSNKYLSIAHFEVWVDNTSKDIIHVAVSYICVFFLIPSLRLALLNEAKEVRAAGLRAFRYLIRDTSVLQKVLRLQVDYLIARWDPAFITSVRHKRTAQLLWESKHILFFFFFEKHMESTIILKTSLQLH